ncbi:phage terminase large subunit family protein [Rhodoplanes sp. SY1]|uniref:phage terminase large subunit family protein n=1 Tax=Rhodoplanes sp. SY1 TaxID=3166646 RepID=UPI0038B5BBF1
MPILLADPTRLAAEAAAQVLEPPPPVDYLAWAEANIVFSDRESPFPGPYNRALFPYFDEILRALSPDDPCRTVTLAGSAQIGKTVVANIFTLGSMAMDPGDLLFTHPTEDNARRWSKMKLAPMLRGTASLRALFPQRSRDVLDSVLYKERADGLGAILISGANSPASLSQVTVRRQVQDDLAKWDMNLAGDPEAQADNRSRAHEFAKVLKTSTPLVLPGCRITKAFEQGSQEHFHVPCPQCGAFQVLDWDNMLATFDPARPEAAHFTCVACGFPIEEHHRAAMVRAGEWRAHNPSARRTHRSFWIWSAYSLLQSFARIALEWFKAKGDPAAEQTFLNDTVGRAWRAQGEAPPFEALRDRAATSHYARGEVPAGALVLTLGIDCQGDRVEWQLVGFGRRHRRFVIDHQVIPGHITDATCRARLDALLKQTWLNAAGRALGLDLAAIDGNAWTEDVWDFARTHPASQLIMVRGVAPDSAPLLARVRKERNLRTGKLLKYASRFYNFGTSVLKMALYRNALKTDPMEDGHVAFPRGLEDEFFRQFTAERRTPFKRHGFTEYRWTKDAAQANEALDAHLQAEAAAIKWGVRGLPDAIWDRLEAERETPPPEAQLSLEDVLGSAPAAPAESAGVAAATAGQGASGAAALMAEIARHATRGR